MLFNDRLKRLKTLNYLSKKFLLLKIFQIKLLNIFVDYNIFLNF